MQSQAVFYNIHFINTLINCPLVRSWVSEQLVYNDFYATLSTLFSLCKKKV